MSGKMPVKGGVFALSQWFAYLPDCRALRPMGGGGPLVRYLGYSPLQIPDGSCDFSFSIACIINQLCDFVKWILKNFFGQAWKRLACEVLEEGGIAFDSLGTHTCDRHLARYAVGLQQTDLNTAELFWTGQYAREQVGVRRLVIWPHTPLIF